MKYLFYSALASLLLVLTSQVNAQTFIGNPTPGGGDTGIFEYWNFNSLSIATASSPGSGGVPTSISSDFGSGTLSLTGWTGLVDDFSGSTGNAQLGDGAEESLSLVGDAGNGSFIQIAFSMTNLEDLSITFDRRGTGTGFSSGQWAYSTNGVDFTNFGPNTATTSTTFSTISSFGTSALDNASTAYLRYTLSGASSGSGNNRIDNLTLSATYAPVPEPTGAVLVGIAGLGAILLRRRRKVA